MKVAQVHNYASSMSTPFSLLLPFCFFCFFEAFVLLMFYLLATQIGNNNAAIQVLKEKGLKLINVVGSLALTDGAVPPFKTPTRIFPWAGA